MYKKAGRFIAAGSDCQKTSLRIKAKGKLVRKKTVRVVFRIKS